MKLYGSIYVIIYILLIAVIFVLPFFSFDVYSITKNSISELGAQKAPGNLVLNSTILFMSLVIILLGFKVLKAYALQLITLCTFSFSFFLTGVFKMAGPYNKSFNYNYTQDALHSLFSTITGFSFCLFCAFLLIILTKKKHKTQTIAMLILAIGFSYFMFKIPDLKGIFQRLLFMSAFAWLFFALVNYEKNIPFRKHNMEIKTFNDYKNKF
ncbi:DUF998 domain-containing protein [uncultured Algibacter sp.]|uniref:DUF998 domain-containing protein n=1 Tax=uncultured Algibacter sp. TaxID=298659 RepID=UPI003217A323